MTVAVVDRAAWPLAAIVPAAVMVAVSVSAAEPLPTVVTEPAAAMVTV